MNDNILEMRSIHKQFPGVYALRDVSFSLKRGEVHIGYDRIISLEPLTKLGGTVAASASMWRQTIPDVSDEALERDIVAGLGFIKGLTSFDKV